VLVLVVSLIGIAAANNGQPHESGSPNTAIGDANQAIAAVRQTKDKDFGMPIEWVVTNAIPMSEEATGYTHASLGWDAEPSDEVVGGGWLVAYRWERSNRVTQAETMSAEWLYNPHTGSIVPTNEWGRLAS